MALADLEQRDGSSAPRAVGVFLCVVSHPSTSSPWTFRDHAHENAILSATRERLCFLRSTAKQNASLLQNHDHHHPSPVSFAKDAAFAASGSGSAQPAAAAPSSSDGSFAAEAGAVSRLAFQLSTQVAT